MLSLYWDARSAKHKKNYAVHLYLQTALHVSGGISTHHQELISLYLQYWDRYCYLSWASRSRQVAVTVSIMPDTVDTVIWAPDDGSRYQPKHVQQFADLNKLYIVASCRIIIATILFILPHYATSPQKHETKDDLQCAPQICQAETGSTCYAR